MIRYVLSRTLQTVVTVYVVVTLVFFASRLLGDPVAQLVPLSADHAERLSVAKQLGLGKPLFTQYYDYLSNLLHGQLGESYQTAQPVTTILKPAAWNSVKLVGAGLLLGGLVGVPVGILSAWRRNGVFDRLARLMAAIGQASPPFWLGLLLVLVFSVHFKVLPSGGDDQATSIVLPAVTIGWYVGAGLLRLTRSSALSALDSEYVRFARLKGVSEFRILTVHVFRNAIAAPLTYATLYFGILAGGTVIVETIFDWPGLGSVAYNTILDLDVPTMQAVVLVIAVVVLVANLMADVGQVLLDPRLRHPSRSEGAVG